jgi:hypothetical protein
MASQTLMFVVLPNGRAAGGRLRLSLLFTPRLDGGATLASFPDILAWTTLAHDHGLAFTIACGSKTATAKASASPLRADLWNAIFAASTFVEAYKIPAFDRDLIVSYPLRQVHDFLQRLYQVVGASGVDPEEEFFRELSFRDDNRGASTIDTQMSEMRVELWNEQHGSMNAPRPLGVHDMATRFELFHHMAAAPRRRPLPRTPKDFEKTLDFHRALTALQSYPTLLRALGLVFDVEVPDSLCPASPAAGAYGSIAVTKVTAGFKWSLGPKFAFPATSYVLSPGAFGAAPAASPADVAEGNFAGGDAADGWLALSDDAFSLVQLDVDGALLKAIGLADNAVLGRADVGDELPALRSMGIGLAADDRALTLLNAIRDNQSFNQALTSGQPLPRPFNARDLVRGYRIDIFSSITGKWHSLHRRSGNYQIGPEGDSHVVQTRDEEGFTQLAVAQPAEDPTRPTDTIATQAGIPQPGTDIYLHERVASWQGWSLSAPRPGLALNRSPDPGKALNPDPTANSPATPFKMVASFAATKGSLPSLRFGARYRLRVRTVDLAGNSLPLSSKAPDALVLPAKGATTPFLRFEPVPPPLVVLRSARQPGSHLLRLVIRSRNATPSADGTPTSATDDRHIAPPKASQRMAEQHGMFDDAHDKLRGDAATYAAIVARDEFDLPTSGGVPLDPSAHVTVGYLPDPVAVGAALRDLPGAPGDSDGRISANGALVFSGLAGVQPREGSVAFIDFGDSWPNRSSFRLVLVEGNRAPNWDAANRVLTVSLPKAHVSDVALSSYLTPASLEEMAVWDWISDYFTADQLGYLQDPGAGTLLNVSADTAALLTRLALEGGHGMITPAETLTLVHAVQQPIGSPEFVQLPVVHQPSQPVFASSLRNLFTPITAWRAHGSHDVVLLGGLKVHGASTVRIELRASWVDAVDDPARPAPIQRRVSGHVATIDLSSLTGGPIAAGASSPSPDIAIYIPQVDTLWFASTFDELAGVETPAIQAAPVHHLADTLHRWVRYEAMATSRFEEYFPAGLDFTRTGRALLVDIPSSARPAAPQVLYVVPTFGWQEQETTTLKTSVRFGQGLRVYLDRPWYSSGPNELLGVLLWPTGVAAPDYATSEKYKGLFSQWANDPIWASETLAPVPGPFNFENVAQVGQGLSLEETAQAFDVAGHEVHFDADRGLWFCDIVFNKLPVYMPFVRMALARYQPHSIDGVELSRAVLADYVQLAPDRSAFVNIDPFDPRTARVVVGGLAPNGPQSNAITVTVDQRDPQVGGDLGWTPAPVAVARVTEDSPAPARADSVLWSGQIVFAKTPAPGAFRLTIREYEVLVADANPQSRRLVYAAIVPYDFLNTQVR